jgi:hypothetical protein
VSQASDHLAWKIRAMCLLRRTTRPITTHPGYILNAGEAKMLEAAYASGWTPKEVVRILVKRDKLESVSP